MNPNDLQKTVDIIKTELTPLADKIGQGVGWTYELFVRQVYVNAFRGLLFIPVGIILAIITKKLIKRGKKEQWESGWVFVALFGGLATWFILDPLADLMQALVNPNYQAIKLILDLVKTQAK